MTPIPSCLRRTLSLAIAALTLSSCVVSGRQFTRPDSSSVSFSSTSKAEVVRRYGPPYSTGQFTKHNVLIDTVHYYYGAQPPGSHFIFKKHCWFYFVGDKLMAYSFVTGFPKEQRDFPATQVTKIVKGKTTRAEVMQLFGEPNGSFQYPVTEERKTVEGDSMIQYAFHRRSSDGSFANKFLQVIFDSSNIAKDVDFEADDKPADSTGASMSDPSLNGKPIH